MAADQVIVVRAATAGGIVRGEANIEAIFGHFPPSCPFAAGYADQPFRVLVD